MRNPRKAGNAVPTTSKVSGSVAGHEGTAMANAWKVESVRNSPAYRLAGRISFTMVSCAMILRLRILSTAAPVVAQSVTAGGQPASQPKWVCSRPCHLQPPGTQRPVDWARAGLAEAVRQVLLDPARPLRAAPPRRVHGIVRPYPTPKKIASWCTGPRAVEAATPFA